MPKKLLVVNAGAPGRLCPLRGADDPHVREPRGPRPSPAPTPARRAQQRPARAGRRRIPAAAPDVLRSSPRAISSARRGARRRRPGDAVAPCCRSRTSSASSSGKSASIAYLEDPVTKRVAGYRQGDTIAGGTVQTSRATGSVSRGRRATSMSACTIRRGRVRLASAGARPRTPPAGRPASARCLRGCRPAAPGARHLPRPEAGAPAPAPHPAPEPPPPPSAAGALQTRCAATVASAPPSACSPWPAMLAGLRDVAPPSRRRAAASGVRVGLGRTRVRPPRLQPRRSDPPRSLLPSSCRPGARSGPDRRTRARASRGASQAQPPPQPAPAAPATARPGPAAPRPAARGRNIVLNFDNADIETVIQAASEIVGFNYVLAPDVRGKVTVQTAGRIPQEDVLGVLLAILEVHGFTAVKSGNLYKIMQDRGGARAGGPHHRGDEPSTAAAPTTRSSRRSCPSATPRPWISPPCCAP